MPIMKVNRFNQEPAQCAIAAISTIANYYDPNIDYECVQKIVRQDMKKRLLNDGLDNGECVELLNLLGFKKVTIVSADLDSFDYSFNKYGRKKQAEILENIASREKTNWGRSVKKLSKCLQDENYNNKVVVDYGFGDHIRRSLKDQKPLILGYNWELFFKIPKTDAKGKKDAVKGSYDEHAVVAYGFNKHGVNICDSQSEHYKYKLKKYSRGYYKISWEHLMAVMANSDLIIPDNFNY